MAEVQERLFLYVLLLVQNSYTSVEVNYLAEMLDLPQADMPKVLPALDYSHLLFSVRNFKIQMPGIF